MRTSTSSASGAARSSCWISKGCERAGTTAAVIFIACCPGDFQRWPEPAHRCSAPASADNHQGPGQKPPADRTRGRLFGARLRAARDRSAILSSQIGQNGTDVPKINLKHRTLPKRILHRSGLESAMPLAEHDLLPFGVLQVNELFLFTPVGNFKTDDVRPEGETDFQVCDVQLGYDFG